MDKYIDDVLIKLRREYSKDEAFQGLTKKLSEVEFKNGVLQSEIDELKHKLKEETLKTQKLLKCKPDLKNRFLTIRLIKSLREEIKDLGIKNKKLKKDNQYLLGKLAIFNQKTD